MPKHILQEVWDKCEFITTLDMIGVCKLMNVKKKDFNKKDINWLMKQRMPLVFSITEMKNDGDLYIVTVQAREIKHGIQENEKFVGRGDSMYAAALTAILFLFQVIALRQAE